MLSVALLTSACFYTYFVWADNRLFYKFYQLSTWLSKLCPFYLDRTIFTFQNRALWFRVLFNANFLCQKLIWTSLLCFSVQLGKALAQFFGIILHLSQPQERFAPKFKRNQEKMIFFWVVFHFLFEVVFQLNFFEVVFHFLFFFR